MTAFLMPQADEIDRGAGQSLTTPADNEDAPIRWIGFAITHAKGASGSAPRTEHYCFTNPIFARPAFFAIASTFATAW